MFSDYKKLETITHILDTAVLALWVCTNTMLWHSSMCLLMLISYSSTLMGKKRCSENDFMHTHWFYPKKTFRKERGRKKKSRQ